MRSSLHTRQSWRSGKILLAASALMTLSACATPEPLVLRPALPAAPPELVMPVPRPIPREGQDARDFAMRNRVALNQANRRLKAFANWYEEVRKEFGDGGQ